MFARNRISWGPRWTAFTQKRRIQNGVHQRQASFAARTDVSRQTINALETGKYDPSLPLAFKIAAVFGKPIEAIFQADDEP